MYDFATKTLSKSEKVTLTHPVEESPYLLIATNRGRLYLFNSLKGKMLYRVCSFEGGERSYISAIASHKESIAISGYGGEIKIISLCSLEILQKISNPHTQIGALLYLCETILLSGDTQGVLTIHNLQNELKKEIQTPFSSISSIVRTDIKNLVEVCSDENETIFVDTDNAKILKAQTLLASEEDLQEYLQRGLLREAYELLEHCSYLRETQTALKAEKLYKKLYTEAFEALLKGEPEQYEELKSNFSTLKEKEEELKALYEASKLYEKFKEFYQEERYSLAYALAQTHQALKETPIYKSMEEKFKALYIEAQKELKKNSIKEAQERLSPFITVREKQEQIALLLRKNSPFIEFLLSVAYREYATIEQLLKEHREFASIPSYISLQRESQQTLRDIKELIIKAKPHKALELIKSYENNFLIQEELKKLYRDALDTKMLLEAYEESNFIRCYELLDNNRLLYSLELSKLLQKHWRRVITQCDNYALEGDIASIKEILGELIVLKSRSKRVGSVIRLAFIVHILTLLEKKRFLNAENFIYSYLDIFGLDKEIGDIMREYESQSKTKLAITIAQNHTLPREYWMRCELIVGDFLP